MKSWEVKKIGDVCTLKSGTTVNKSLEKTSGDVPYLKVADMSLPENDLVITTSSRFLNEDALKKNSLFPIGTTIFPKRGGAILTNKKRLTAIPVCADLNIMGVIPSKALLPKFLYFYFLNIDMRELGSGSSIPQINNYDIAPLTIAFPTCAEQKRIVAILDEAFERIDGAIANTEKNLANARELFESYLNAIFTRKGRGWRDLTLQEISAKFSRGKSKHRPRGDQKLYGGKYPFIQTSDIGNSKHRIIDYSQTYNDFGLAQSELWPRGTVCIAIVGANIAETAILEFDACFPDSVIGIVVNSDIASSDYVEYLLQFFKSEIKAKGKGTARENINMGTFANQRFPFPDLETQKAIACQLDELSFQSERIEEVYQQKLAALNELKQSILQKAFSGELTADTAAQAANAAQEVTAA